VRRALATIVLLLVCGGHARAWNTETQDDSLGWQAAYLGNSQVGSLPASGWTRNEHSELSHVILKELALDGLYGLRSSGGGGMTVIDLNSALYQPQVAAAAHVGDNPNTLLEERFVPNPAYFTGLPDYSWAVHDWINKNSFCPPLPPGADARDYCYLFAGWMGMLNANHFGTQARKMYARYHAIALDVAGRAKTLREALAAARFPDDASAYAQFVLEGEMEALIFESVGQHFLQDRWSTGHMWERWNGNDYATAAPTAVSFFVAAASGLLHGSEGITKLPDPLGSPVVVSTPPGNTAVPVRWRIPGLDAFPGVGDYRLEDMHDGLFGAGFGFGDLPIDVEEQRARMFACAKAGWAEVIRGFGERAPGEWGLFGVPLPPAGVPVVENSECWEPWATNSAMAAGWLEHPSLSDIDKQARTVAVAETAAIGEIRERIVPLLDATWQIASRAAIDGPNETTLAQGAIGPILGVDTGDFYTSIPSYTEPFPLDALPDRDPEDRGRDKHAVFGFFNRAHADWWCENFEDVMLNLRGSDHPVDAAVCALLADRVYKGTDPAYRGINRELRKLALSGDESDPLCRFHGVETAGVDENLPYYLHPGYVFSSGAGESGTFQSVVSWCRMLPVVDTGPCPDDEAPDDDDAWDVAARVTTAGGTVTLTGHNFGDAGGEVLLAVSAAGPFNQSLPTSSWTDTEITLTVPALVASDWYLQIRPGGDAGRASVGRFVLRVGDETCGIIEPSLVGFWLLGNADNFYNPIALYFFDDGLVATRGTSVDSVRTVATWSASGNTVSVDPCPGQPQGAFTFRFRGTWSAHPVTDDFGILSCRAPNEDNCPAMRGQYWNVLSDGSEIPALVEFHTRDGYTTLAAQFPGRPGAIDCHGGCYETWANFWPHFCGPIPGFCAGALAPECGGHCPDDFVCTDSGFGCKCFTETPVECVPPNGPCPEGMTCFEGICIH
jgi:hypothetical protein